MFYLPLSFSQFYYFPSSIFLFPPPQFYNFNIFPPPPPTSTPHRLYSDSTSTPHRPHVDPTSTPHRPYIFPPPPPPHFYCFPSKFGLLGRLGLILASLAFRGKTIEMRRRRRENIKIVKVWRREKLRKEK